MIFCEADHLKARGLDITTHVEIKGDVERQGRDLTGVKGRIRTQRSVVNYTPFEEMDIFYHLSKESLEILSFKIGEDVQLVGRVDIGAPHDVEFLIKMDESDPSGLFKWVQNEKRRLIPGRMSGRIRIHGPLASASSSGYLRLVDGYFGDVDYEVSNIKIEGEGADISVIDSRIHRKEGHLLMEGDVDLAMFGERNIFQDLIIKSDEETIIWNGWDITREKGGDDLRMGKDIGEDFRINFNTFVNDETVYEEKEGKGLELEYKIKEHESLKMRLESDDEFLGVEHRKKF